MARPNRLKNKGPDEETRRVQQDRLFCATLLVALDQGYGHVTLDAVAAKAGISKGGLLYHFPTKAKLIEAMLMRWLNCSKDDVASPLHSQEPFARPIDPLAVATLIAGAEDPLLLETCAEQLLSKQARQDLAVLSPEHRARSLTAALARHLALR
ncbi:TetR/AcrR family transcriptional regulator [Tianweitania sp.]|uniref:TetR/AcrR family transcriptional regulator n=1 Tax=Tianweitania sp. TaxID=2021634 RepID=UPI00289A589E|nr:TetR/AcrR family transcriptional regulator [Tianweitania sp.]